MRSSCRCSNWKLQPEGQGGTLLQREGNDQQQRLHYFALGRCVKSEVYSELSRTDLLRRSFAASSLVMSLPILKLEPRLLQPTANCELAQFEASKDNVTCSISSCMSASAQNGLVWMDTFAGGLIKRVWLTQISLVANALRLMTLGILRRDFSHITQHMNPSQNFLPASSPK